MKINGPKIALTLVVALLAIVITSAHAQVISISTTSGGANAQVGASIASIVSSNTDYQMRPQKLSGSQQAIEAVARGRAHFSLANAMQYYMAVSGTGLSEGEPKENLRLVATLMPFIQGVIVRADSGIESIADLEGMRVPSGYSSSPLFATFWEAFLSDHGLTYDDVRQVPVASLPRSWDAFKEGQVDAVIGAAGSAAVREMAAVIPGGIKYLPVHETPELLAALPRTRVETIETSEAFEAISEPTDMHVYEYVLFTNVDVDDEIVEAVARAIHENEEALRASTPLWNTYRPQNIAMDHDLDYHPAAQQFYGEQGMWNR